VSYPSSRMESAVDYIYDTVMPLIDGTSNEYRNDLQRISHCPFVASVLYSTPFNIARAIAFSPAVPQMDLVESSLG